MVGIPPLAPAPFVISTGVFANPKYRGFRMPATDTVSLDELRTMSVNKQIRIHDARQLPDPPTLDSMGFTLTNAPLEIDFYDPNAIATNFRAYCSDLVKAATGCLAARVVQHEVRTGEATGPGGMGIYAQMAHSDVSPFIENFVNLPPQRHFGLYTVWRSIDRDREIDVMPLALCDATTVDAADIVYADSRRLTWPQTRLIDCRLIHSNHHLWFYYPRMKPEEVLIFRQYDTRQSAANLRSTFHTAFEDEITQENAPARHSIEARVLAVFHEEDTDRVVRRERFQAEVPKVLRDGTTSAWHQENMVDWDSG